jgi:hypothetical protein
MDDLTAWVREFDRLYDQTFREVSLVAVGIITGSPVLGRPHQPRTRSTRFPGWRPNSSIGYVMGNSFRPSRAWAPEVEQLHAVALRVGSPTIGAPRLDWSGVVSFGDFTKDHRWRPRFHSRLE